MNKRLNLFFILSLISVILSVSLYVYFYNNLTKSKVDVSNYHNRVSEAKAKLENLQTIEKNLKNTIEEGDVIASLFLRSNSVAEFIQTIEGLIRETGLQGSVDSVTEITSSDLDVVGKEKLSLVIGANGKWSGMVNLLGLLERLPYKSTIDSFTLVNSKSEDTVTNEKKKIGVKEWHLKVGMMVWAEKKTLEESDPKPTIETEKGADEHVDNQVSF